MLHTINKSPFESDSLVTCLRFAQPGDVILLIEDGVYAAKAKTKYEPLIKEASKDVKFFALCADLDARGMKDLIIDISCVNYEGFVDLVVEHQVNAWL